MGKLRSFLRRRSEDRWLLLQTFLLLTAVRLGMRFLSFPVLLQWVQKYSNPLPSQSSKSDSIPLQKIIWAVNRSSHYMPGGVLCLARALTTKIVCDRQGHTCTLRIGVKKDEKGQLQAHAWIEQFDQVVIGHLPDLSHYRPLPQMLEAKP
jgi:hypothetical protein